MRRRRNSGSTSKSTFFYLDNTTLTDQSSRTLQKGLTELKQISSDGFVHQIVEHEAKEWKIAKIFSRFNEARVQFEVPHHHLLIRVISSLSFYVAGDWHQGLRERVYNRSESQGS